MNVYTMVTDRIIKQLEQGKIPWHRPWIGESASAISHSTGKAYSYLNQMLLCKSGEFITYKQCQEEGGRIRKGERSTPVVFWKMFNAKQEDDNGEESFKVVPMLRYYQVFHIDQCEGINPKYPPEVEVEHREFDADVEAERIVSDYQTREGVRIEHSPYNNACYRPMSDTVCLPDRDLFDCGSAYYSTLFHELTHSTGKDSRLGRIVSTRFGSHEYSKEELVAEIGAAVMCSKLGLETSATIQNTAAYIGSWIERLRNDSKMIVTAACKAEKAVALLTGEIEDDEQLGISA